MATTQIHLTNQALDNTLSTAKIIDANVTDAKLAELYIKANGTRAFTADQSLGGFKITSLGTPTAGTDAANKNYVDAAAAGIDWKASVRVATTANITLSGAQTIDGVSAIAGDRVLVKDQTAGEENGIYVVAAGAWSRATDADVSAEVTSGMATFVSEGTASADSAWVLITNDPITLGTTALVFTQFTGLGQITAGAGLTKTGNTLDVGDINRGIQANADSLEFSASEAAGSGLAADTNAWQLKLTDTGVSASSYGSATQVATFTVDAQGRLSAAANATIAIAQSQVTNLVTDLAAKQLRATLTTKGDLYVATASDTVVRRGVGTNGQVLTADSAEVDGVKWATPTATPTFVTRETPSGTINGANVTFTLANTPTAGSEMLFMNGLLQNLGGSNDYTISGATITYNTAPATGSVLLVSYRY